MSGKDGVWEVFGRLFCGWVGGSKWLKFVFLLVMPLKWQKGNRGRKGRETVGELGFVVCSKSVNSESEGGAVRRCDLMSSELTVCKTDV